VAVVDPVSNIRAAIEPFAENVCPPAAFVLEVPFGFTLVALLVVPLLLVALAVLVVLDVALPEVLPAPLLLADGGGVYCGVLYCAAAGARLDAAAKSPKTSTSATAIDAFFIAKSVQK
jgi:hypothetical protein